jgi:electron transport complex protein RnfC
MHTFPHGIHPDDAKQYSADKKIERFPFAPYFVLHLSQHAGKPAKPLVKEGQEVKRGQLIAAADGFISAPIHSPVDGQVLTVGSSLDFNGKMSPSIIIKPFAASAQNVAVENPVDVENLSPQEIVEGVKNMGMVGLGGAAFPTFVKLMPPKGKTIETIILNGAECEPYLTSDHRVMLEMPERVVAGAKLLKKAVSAKEVVIAVEHNKPDALEALKKACEGLSDIRVEVFQTKYPQGAEKMLTSALLGKEIPSGGLPADIGVMISNVATAAEVATLLPKGQGLIERVVTVTGDGVKKPGNYIIPIGTPLDFVLDHVGLIGDAHKIIFGGPMMGKAVTYVESPITKGTSGIVVIAESKLKEDDEIYPCIRCSECVKACPIRLIPSRLGILSRNGNHEKMADEYNLFDCFECGSCSYVCPSNIPLVQYFRLSKQIVRERKVNA